MALDTVTPGTLFCTQMEHQEWDVGWGMPAVNRLHDYFLVAIRPRL